MSTTMDPHKITLVQQSFEKVAGLGVKAAELFDGKAGRDTKKFWPENWKRILGTKNPLIEEPCS